MADRREAMSKVSRTIGSLLTAVLLAPAAASPQEAPGPPPPSSDRSAAGPEVHELLPDLGRIGSEVGILAGPSWNPYEVGRGFQLGGFVDLPLTRVPGGKLSYQILIAFSDAKSDPFVTTNSIAFVANLAAGASPADALAGPPAAPFPVRREVTTRLHLLQVSPFALKYQIQKLDHLRLRPYFGLGLDFLVAITRQDPVRDESLIFTGTAPFDAALIAALIAQAPELTDRKVPTGQGNMEIGGHAMAGVEVRVSRGLSVNLEYRLTQIGSSSGRLHALSTALGFHW
jgi:opacity protein-like surface antigen